MWLTRAATSLIGAGLPALVVTDSSSAMLLGISMIPRAEIAMVIADTARRLSPDLMPPDAHAAMVLVVLATCVATPLLLAARLRARAAARVSS